MKIQVPRFLVLTAIFATGPIAAHCQGIMNINSVRGIEIPLPRIWTPPQPLPNNTFYNVDLNKVCSISLQKYVSRTLAVQGPEGVMPILNGGGGQSLDQKTTFLYADVTEMTIETLGGIPARFYAVMPHKPQGDVKASVGGVDITQQINDAKEQVEKIQQSAGNITTDAQDNKETKKTNQASMVMKDYPFTTHARNIEFRLATPDDVTAIYNDAMKNWNPAGAPRPSPPPPAQ